MRTVIQRVSEASVTIDGAVHGEIGQGYLILAGFCDADDGYHGTDSLRHMVEAIEETKADIVQFGNYVNKFGTLSTSLRVNEELTIDRTQLMQEDIAGAMGAYNQKINLNVWAKIYRGRVLKAASPDLNLPLINAEDLYLNCCAFFNPETQHVAFKPICEYVYNTGIGVSGNGVLCMGHVGYHAGGWLRDNVLHPDCETFSLAG